MLPGQRLLLRQFSRRYYSHGPRYFGHPASSRDMSPSNYYSMPYVIEQTVLSIQEPANQQGRSERTYDIFSRLLKERIICLNGTVFLCPTSLISGG
jgi:hypothetical protein